MSGGSLLRARNPNSSREPGQWESWSGLMGRVQSGDQGAYRLLLEEMGPLLYRFVRRRVFDPELVADVYHLHKAGSQGRLHFRAPLETLGARDQANTEGACVRA